ncbi:YjjG family noncanonical pyrimidine nucleotidase [Tamlana sp. 2201CG12-4]|uniref:YjjG family noncanonical pyrimidine nucleotidase n=1 Tax=Tamlana sp. 2201CG12-4 TaxID=3112582 RepID=UPI002DBA557F|nr:YjjG family noncanonical pyrimidine nucleotidase [Tamlana sp. 2201CG12-4]MEC3906900.1 YjjG family noncanonical pyrimidine nucleotidase [Tamlana sp. 2201CG12-4]
MKIDGITDVFFDLDHTLWDFDKNSALTFKRIFQMNDLNVELKKFLLHYEPINLKYWKLYREEKIKKETLRFCRLNEAFQAINYNVEEELIYKLSDDYITHLTSFNHLFDYTFEILDYLSFNYNLHIITNGFEEVQHMKLAKSGIDKYFKTITNSEMVGVKKPNSKIFNYALKQANAQTDKSLMIGDSYEADILGAKNVGMEVIFFDIKGTKIDDDIIQINSLSRLKKYL